MRVPNGYVVRDLGSTNGTFVNGTQVREHWLREGDVLLIAHKEMRFGVMDVRDSGRRERTLTTKDESQQRIFRETNDLLRILDKRGVRAVFQPIVRLGAATRVGYETLGRVAMADVDYHVGELFRIAVERGDGARLSRLMRERALEECPKVPEAPVAIFFNLHPTEMKEPDILQNTIELLARSMGSGQRAVLEIHESAVTDRKTMADLRARMVDRGVALAYDDFGAGQSRLMELIEVPPDYLKLDMSLVRDIDKNGKRRELVRALVSVIRDMGIEVLAEGIERQEEADVCHQLGCGLGQGFLFGRPATLGG